jgi:hypothetical protein
MKKWRLLGSDTEFSHGMEKCDQAHLETPNKKQIYMRVGHGYIK